MEKKHSPNNIKNVDDNNVENKRQNMLNSKNDTNRKRYNEIKSESDNIFHNNCRAKNNIDNTTCPICGQHLVYIQHLKQHLLLEYSSISSKG